MMSEGYTYPYPRPMVTVDAAVFSLIGGRLAVLLIKRGRPPFLGMWALPGGFLDMDEEIGAGAARELAEETGVTGVRLEQFHAFGAVDRDPRGRVITIAYAGIADHGSLAPKADDDAADIGWMPVCDLPALASDHGHVIQTAVRWLETRLADPGYRDGCVPKSISVDMLRLALRECIEE